MVPTGKYAFAFGRGQRAGRGITLRAEEQRCDADLIVRGDRQGEESSFFLASIDVEHVAITTFVVGGGPFRSQTER